MKPISEKCPWLPSFTFLISHSCDFQLIWLLMYVGHAPKPKQCCLSLASKHSHVDKEVLEIISSGKDDDDQCADEEQLGSYWAEEKCVWLENEALQFIQSLAGRIGDIYAQTFAFTICLIVPRQRLHAALHAQVQKLLRD